jgi:hypothetical protein
MKQFLLALVLAGFAWSRAWAQVSLNVTMDQEQFLPGEALPVAVNIVNQSGQPVHLGASPDWLTFNLESSDGFVVTKTGEVPVLGAFDLESSQLGIKRADLQPYFIVSKPGRYKITATLRIRDWSVTATSPAKYFDVINGADLWSQNFGLPPAPGVSNAPPELRKYTLVEANYLRSELRLYIRVTDAADVQVFKVAPLGQLVSFSHPEAQVDRTSRLHVLWQTGAQAFTYCLVNSDGVLVQQEVYDYFTTRPRLDVNADGNVIVAGGTKRLHPADYPAVKSPAELPPPSALAKP